MKLLKFQLVSVKLEDVLEQTKFFILCFGRQTFGAAVGGSSILKTSNSADAPSGAGEFEIAS